MGNGSSVVPGPTLDPKLLQSGLLVNQTFMYDVTAHHTTQRAYSNKQIIQFKQVDRQNEGRLKIKQKPRLQFCLERHFQLNELLSNASIPTKCRHPSILRVHRSLSDPFSSSLFLLTEPCLPLKFLISSSSDFDLLLGARSILAALEFIHINLSLSHNNIRMTSVFVGNDGNWKLGGFEFAVPFSQMDLDVVELLERLLGTEAEPNESVLVYHHAYPFCYDIYAFARLFTMIVSDYGKASQLFTDFLQVLHKSCMHPQPVVRLTASQLLVHPIFRHPLAFSIHFLGNYVTHTDTEKVAFFHTFQENIAEQLPVEVVCQKLLPLCLHNTVFLDPPSQCLIMQILQPQPDSDCHQPNSATPEKRRGSWLSHSAFKKYVAPLVLGKFRVHERHTRITLLERFSSYAHLFEMSELKDTILPEVCLSLFDQHSILSQLSLRALGELSNVLGATQTLNELRQTELRLSQQGVFTSRSNANKHSNALWPRAHLFPEAAPKITRQQRDIPVSEQKRNGTKIPLAMLAPLSSNYEPNSNPLLHQFVAETEAENQPQTLSGNVVKVSTTRANITPVKSDDTHSTMADELVETVSSSNKDMEIANSCPPTDGQCDLNSCYGKLDVNRLRSVTEPASTDECIRKEIAEPCDNSVDAINSPMRALRMRAPTPGEENEQTDGNDWDNDWDFDT